jgi:NAD(P)-dependent dehydrogenase (short-subunit alcohol dehydrogenase family)
MMLSDPRIAENLGEAYTHGQSKPVKFFFDPESKSILQSIYFSWANPRILTSVLLVFPWIDKGAEFQQGAIVFMASDASKFMTGSEIRVDGGYCVI